MIERAILEEVMLANAAIRMLLTAMAPGGAAETDALLEKHRATIRDWIAKTFPEPDRAEPVELPAACREETEEHCARRNPEALLELGRKDGGTYQRMCRGCGDSLSGG